MRGVRGPWEEEEEEGRCEDEEDEGPCGGHVRMRRKGCARMRMRKRREPRWDGRCEAGVRAV